MPANFYQCSDDVPAVVITGVTGTCDRDDCHLSARMQGSTMMGTSQHYNKQGQKAIEDPNRFTVEVCCISCRHAWIVDQDGKVQA